MDQLPTVEREKRVETYLSNFLMQQDIKKLRKEGWVWISIKDNARTLEVTYVKVEPFVKED